jgi:hypothetical protein
MSHFWNVSPDELLVSFDGAEIHMPPEITNNGWFRGAKWLHTDQSYIRNDFECVQSWLTAFDVETGNATLIFLEGSHQYHGDFLKRFYPVFPTKDKKEKEIKQDFYLLFDDQKKIDFYKSKRGVLKSASNVQQDQWSFGTAESFMLGRNLCVRGQLKISGVLDLFVTLQENWQVNKS